MSETAGVNRTGESSPAGLELATFLRLLWSNRKWLVITVLGGMFLAGVASYLVDETYKARSKVLVEVPKRREKSEIFGDPLTVLGYDSLLGADESFLRVLEALKSLRQSVLALQQEGASLEEVAAMSQAEIAGRTRAATEETNLLAALSLADLRGLTHYTPEDFEKLEFESFKKKFLSHTSVEKETGVSITYSPIIDLDATGDTPEKAALLANLWALTFIEHVRETISEKSGQIVDEILQVYQSTQEKLEEANKKVEQYRQEIGLAGLRQELEAKQLSLYGVSLRTVAETDEQGKPVSRAEQAQAERLQEALIPQQTRIEKDIQTDEEQLALLDGLLGQLEEKGIWVGEVAFPGEDPVLALEAQIAAASERLSLMEKTLQETEGEYSLAQLRRDVETAVEQRDFLRSRYLDWRARMNAANPEDVRLLNELEDELRRSSDELIRLQARLLQRQVERQRLDGARLRLSHLSARLNLLKVAGRHRGTAAEELQAAWQRQELEAVEEQLRQARAQLLQAQAERPGQEAGLDAPLAPKEQFYEATVQKLEQERNRLQKLILQGTQQRLEVAREVKEASSMFGLYRNQYLRFKNKRDSLVYQLQENRAANRALQEQIRKLQEEISTLSFKIGQSEATVKRLENERDSVREALADFSKQVSEARVEKERQIADVRVQARAVPPDQRISPNRRIWVITAGAFVLLIDLAFLLLRRVLETVPAAS